VWLDLAKDYNQQSLLSALEELVRMGQVSLLTPMLVVEEFQRNKERIIEESGRSIGSTLRRAKEMLRSGEQRLIALRVQIRSHHFKRFIVGASLTPRTIIPTMA
jgi:hypothetical protein